MVANGISVKEAIKMENLERVPDIDSQLSSEESICIDPDAKGADVDSYTQTSWAQEIQNGLMYGGSLECLDWVFSIFFFIFFFII